MDKPKGYVWDEPGNENGLWRKQDFGVCLAPELTDQMLW